MLINVFADLLLVSCDSGDFLSQEINRLSASTSHLIDDFIPFLNFKMKLPIFISKFFYLFVLNFCLKRECKILGSVLFVPLISLIVKFDLARQRCNLIFKLLVFLLHLSTIILKLMSLLIVFFIQLSKLSFCFLIFWLLFWLFNLIIIFLRVNLTLLIFLTVLLVFVRNFRVIFWRRRLSSFLGFRTAWLLQLLNLFIYFLIVFFLLIFRLFLSDIRIIFNSIIIVWLLMIF